MICMTDFRFRFESYEDLAGQDSYQNEDKEKNSVGIEFIFMSDSNLYMFVGYLLSNGVDPKDIRDITPLLDELRCKDLEDNYQGCYVLIDFTKKNFAKYSKIIKRFSNRFNMATSNY